MAEVRGSNPLSSTILNICNINKLSSNQFPTYFPCQNWSPQDKDFYLTHYLESKNKKSNKNKQKGKKGTDLFY
jgi:hypothetical protein